tara:strand:- start:775 stop:1671 length:897 start_codon:yes stop_codon:yes gene_type:complete
MLATFGGGSANGFKSAGVAAPDEFFSFNAFSSMSIVSTIASNSGYHTTQSIKDIIFTPDGMTCFTMPYGSGNHPISKMSLSTAWDLRSTTSTTNYTQWTNNGNYETIWCFSADGLHFVAGSRTVAHHYILTSAFDLSSVTNVNAYYDSMSLSGGAQGCGYSKDGSIFWYYNRNNPDLIVENLSTPFALGSASSNSSYTRNSWNGYGTTTNDKNSYGHYMSGDGTSIATIASFQSSTIRYHNMTTPYNFNSIIQSTNISYSPISGMSTQQMGLAITPDYIYFADEYGSGNIRMYSATIT